MENAKNKIKEELKSVKKEIRDRLIGYIVAALGLVAGLAWNDAIKALIEYLFPLSKDSLQAKFIYAGVITLVIVLVTVYLLRLIRKENVSSDKK